MILACATSDVDKVGCKVVDVAALMSVGEGTDVARTGSLEGDDLDLSPCWSGREVPVVHACEVAW